MKEIINKIASECLPVREKIRSIPVNTELYKNKKNILSTQVEKQLVSKMKDIIKHNNLEIKGRIGGNPTLADVPWIGIHNQDIDSKAQTGIYATILFKADGSGVVLSIQQGTEGRKPSDIKSDTNKIRDFIDFDVTPFYKLDMDLKGIIRMKNDSRPAKYGIASIIGKEYTLNDMDSIDEDFNRLIDIYLKISNKVIDNFDEKEDEYQYQSYNGKVDDEQLNSEPEKPKERISIIKGAKHPPRNPLQGKVAAEKSNYECELDSTHKTFITPDNLNYIEKHHLIPMKYYFDFKDYTIDHSFNIYTLCPVCHRQIHFGTDDDKKELIEKLFEKREDIYKEYYKIDLKSLISMYIK